VAGLFLDLFGLLIDLHVLLHGVARLRLDLRGLLFNLFGLLHSVTGLLPLP
jgi:hypothetical protein